MERPISAVIIGGGPGGATAGYYLARAGLRAVVVEQQQFPRYCVGESLLPHNMELFRDMGFDRVLEKEGFVRKFGACFGNADGDTLARVNFGDGLLPEVASAYQVPRDRFDDLLLRHAVERGVELVQGTVRDLLYDGDRVVGVLVSRPGEETEEIRAPLVIDASGRRAFIGKKLGLMEHDTRLDNASVFGLYEGVEHPSEAKPGDITILAFDCGWFWFIPFGDGRTSVGAVVDRWVYDNFEGDRRQFLDDMFARAGGRLLAMMSNATPLNDAHVLRRFNRRAREFAGAGWVLVGDAAMFIDPVFSAGVLVATTEGRLAAETATPLLQQGIPIDARHFEGYHKAIEYAYGVFERYIYNWRDPDFRRFFLEPPTRGRTVRTVTTILAGGVFDPELIGHGDLPLFAVVAAYRLWRRVSEPVRRLLGAA